MILLCSQIKLEDSISQPAYANPTGWRVERTNRFAHLEYTHDFLYVVPRVSVSRRALQCRVRHFIPTYDMTKELQLK